MTRGYQEIDNHMDVLLHAQIMHATATRLLEESQLLSLLRQHGVPELNGSYSFDLMYGSDVDIDMFTDDPRGTSRRVLDMLLDQSYFQRYEYGDFDHFAVANRPRGYILVLGARVDGVYWEIEIWFLYERSAADITVQQLMQQPITSEVRELILRLKHERYIQGKGKHAVSSMDIYRGVLKHQLTTLDAIERYLPAIRAQA